MKPLHNIKQKVKTRKFIFGIFVFLITLILCLLLFSNWDTIKTIILGS